MLKTNGHATTWTLEAPEKHTFHIRILIRFWINSQMPKNDFLKGSFKLIWDQHSHAVFSRTFKEFISIKMQNKKVQPSGDKKSRIIKKNEENPFCIFGLIINIDSCRKETCLMPLKNNYKNMNLHCRFHSWNSTLLAVKQIVQIRFKKSIGPHFITLFSQASHIDCLLPDQLVTNKLLMYLCTW